MLFPSVLITSGRMPVALELARSLHRAGARVVVLDSVDRFICQGSSSVYRSYKIPSPNDHFESYKAEILRIVEQENIQIIFPMTEDVFHLSKMVAELPESVELFASSHDLLLLLHHKQRFIEFARSVGLGVPASEEYRSSETLPAFCSEDYILKKVYSRAGTGVLFPKSQTTPEMYGVPNDGSWLLQEKLKGKQYCSCTIMNQGQILAHVVYEPSVVNGTTSIVFKESKVPAIRTWVETFAEHTSFHGTVSFDFFVDDEGRAKAIECNPRPTSGYHVIDEKTLAKALLERSVDNPGDRYDRRAQILLPTLMAIPSLIAQNELFRALKDIVGARDVVFSRHDLIPFFYQIPCAIAVFYRSLLKGIPAASCMMDGLEWDEQFPTKTIQWVKG